MKIGRRRKRFLLDNYLFVGRNSVTLVTTQHDHLHGHGGMLLYVRPIVQFYLLNDLLSHQLLLLRNESCPQQTWNQKIFSILIKRFKILKIRQLYTKGGNVFWDTHSSSFFILKRDEMKNEKIRFYKIIQFQKHILQLTKCSKIMVS